VADCVSRYRHCCDRSSYRRQEEIVMKKLSIAALLFTVSSLAFAQTVYRAQQTRCTAGTVSCNFLLSDPAGNASSWAAVNFNRPNINEQINPDTELQAYATPGYVPKFTVSEHIGADNTLNYGPANIVWSTANGSTVLDYTTAAGGRGHVVFILLAQYYGCGRTKCHGTFWTVLNDSTVTQ
jgi:hypothetical protein